MQLLFLNEWDNLNVIFPKPYSVVKTKSYKHHFLQMKVKIPYMINIMYKSMLPMSIKTTHSGTDGTTC